MFPRSSSEKLKFLEFLESGTETEGGQNTIRTTPFTPFIVVNPRARQTSHEFLGKTQKGPSRALVDKGYYGGSVLCIQKYSLLCRDICLMQRTKSSSDIMTNSLLCIQFCICQSKCKRVSIEQKHENMSMWFSLVGIRPWRKLSWAMSLLCKNVVQQLVLQ